jgi:hypothetical protein
MNNKYQIGDIVYYSPSEGIICCASVIGIVWGDDYASYVLSIDPNEFVDEEELYPTFEEAAL